MTGLSEQKREARRVAKIRRETLRKRESVHATETLSNVLLRYRGRPLAGYIPIGTEIDPVPAMIEAAVHGIVGVPVVQTGIPCLQFSVWTPDCEMRAGHYNVPVPVAIEYFNPEVMIVPLLAFDGKGHRLGYGGGYYDRIICHLKRRRPTLVVGFAYAEQEIREVPVEETDHPLDMIVTEREIREFL